MRIYKFILLLINGRNTIYHALFVQPLELLYRNFKTMGAVIDMPQHCVADKVVRDASSKAEEKIEEFNVSLK